MKTHLFMLAALAALFAATPPAAARTVSSDTVGFVQFASEDALDPSESEAVPGQLVATEWTDPGSNLVASLSIGLPSGERVPVADRYALRTRRIRTVDYPDFFIECGSNTHIVATYTVRLFENEILPGYGETAPPPTEDTHVRRYFRVKPLNGKYLTSAKVTVSEVSSMESSLMNNNFSSHEVSELNGELYVEGSFKRWGKDLVVGKLDITLEVVYAADAMQPGSRMTYDFSTRSNGGGTPGTEYFEDFYFRDDLGRTSLGALRKWVVSYTGSVNDKSNHWWKCAAEGEANLAGNDLKLARGSWIHTGGYGGVNNAQTWYVGEGKVGLRIVRGTSSDDGVDEDFKILQIDVSSSREFDYIYVNTRYEDPYALERHDLTSGDWTRAPGQVTVLGEYEGEPAYVVTIPKDGTNRRFYRAAAETGGEGSTPDLVYSEFPMFVKGGLALRAPNGTWWKFSVDNAGNLTKTNLLTAPPGVDEF